MRRAITFISALLATQLKEDMWMISGRNSWRGNSRRQVMCYFIGQRGSLRPTTSNRTEKTPKRPIRSVSQASEVEGQRMSRRWETVGLHTHNMTEAVGTTPAAATTSKRFNGKSSMNENDEKKRPEGSQMFIARFLRFIPWPPRLVLCVCVCWGKKRNLGTEHLRLRVNAATPETPDGNTRTGERRLRGASLRGKMAGNKATADENIAALSTESIQKMAAVNNITWHSPRRQET
jgi:hypothetical protein